MDKLGLIAGGGELPHAVIQAVKEAGGEIFVAALDGEAEPSDFDVESKVFHLGEFGRMTKAFKRQKVSHICMAGNVKRPDFKKLKPDFKAVRYLPGVIKAAKAGDDSLLKFIVAAFEKEGFEVAAPQDICQNLLMPEGFLGEVRLGADHRDDTEKACKTAQSIGALDIGQGAVVCRGLILAVEAQEGTDRMLERVCSLPEDIRGNGTDRAGVLAKMLKPGQEKRVDLPTIGLSTVEKADRAGLAGIAVEAGRCFVMDRAAVTEAADEAGIFIVGIPPSTHA